MKSCENCIHLFAGDNCALLRAGLRRKPDGTLMPSPRCGFEFFEEVPKVEPQEIVEQEPAQDIPEVEKEEHLEDLIEILKEKSQDTPKKKKPGRPKKSTK